MTEQVVAKGDPKMSLYYSQQLVRLLVHERLQEASRARILREGGQNMYKAPRRSVLDLFRRQVPADCVC
ncbi:MAG: hypothetical protein ABSC46_07165 [Candidatus Limnocylindrales bacterium]